MKKVILVGMAMAFAQGICITGDVGTVVAQTIELKMAHFMSPMHIQHQKSFAPFCKKVEELTRGKIKIKIYPGGALGRPKQLPDAVKTGVTDIAFIIPGYRRDDFRGFWLLIFPLSLIARCIQPRWSMIFTTNTSQGHIPRNSPFSTQYHGTMIV